MVGGCAALLGASLFAAYQYIYRPARAAQYRVWKGPAPVLCPEPVLDLAQPRTPAPSAEEGLYDQAVAAGARGDVEATMYYLQEAACSEEGIDVLVTYQQPELVPTRKDTRWVVLSEYLKEAEAYYRSQQFSQVVRFGRDSYQHTDRLIVWMHGYGRNPQEDLSPYGELIANICQCEVVGISGTVARRKNSFSWTQLASRDHGHIEQQLGELGLSHKKPTLVGISHGAQSAIELVAAYPEVYQGALAISPGGLAHAGLRLGHKNKATSKNGVVIVVGGKENPGNRKLSKEAHQWFTEAGARSELRITADQKEHAEPADFLTMMPAWLSFINQENSNLSVKELQDSWKYRRLPLGSAKKLPPKPDLPFTIPAESTGVSLAEAAEQHTPTSHPEVEGIRKEFAKLGFRFTKPGRPEPNYLQPIISMAQQGKPDQAIYAALRASQGKGINYAELYQHEDLIVLRNSALWPAFSTYLRQLENYWAARGGMRSARVRNNKFVKAKHSLVLLHDNFGKPEDMIDVMGPYLSSICKCEVVGISGTRAQTDALYTWSEDHQSDHQHIQRQLKELRLADKQVFLVGNGQGGQVSLELLGNYPESYRGAIAISPKLLLEDTGSLGAGLNPGAQYRSAVIVTRKQASEIVRKQAEASWRHLQAGKVAVKLHSSPPKLRHGLPADLPEHFPGWLNYLSLPTRGR